MSCTGVKSMRNKVFGGIGIVWGGALLARWLMADATAAGLAAYQSGQSGAVLFGLLTLGVPNIHLLTLADAIATLWSRCDERVQRHLLAIASHFTPNDGGPGPSFKSRDDRHRCIR